MIGRLNRTERPRARRITAEALSALVRQSWPGNVRELEAALERAVHALAPGGTVTAASLGGSVLCGSSPMVRERPDDLRGRTRRLEEELIRDALARAGGNKTRAASALGLTRQGLWKKIRRLERLDSP